MTPIPKAYWVLPEKFMAGPYPGDVDDGMTRRKINWLLMQGVDFILDLTESDERELIPYANYLQEQAQLLGHGSGFYSVYSLFWWDWTLWDSGGLLSGSSWDEWGSSLEAYRSIA